MEITGLAQREAWTTRSLPPVEKVRANLWSIPIPIADSPLRYTSVYALANDADVTLIDAGWNSDASWQALIDGLEEFGAGITDVQGVLVTHQHFDHIGLAGRIREAAGAWIALHPADNEALLRPTFRNEGLALAAERNWLMRLGASREEAVRLRPAGGMDRNAAFVVPDRLIENGQDVGVPGWSLRAIHTPGHTPGHLCFHDEATDLLFAGDTVLPRITPNVSVSAHDDGDALGEFLSSLDLLVPLEPDEVLPAHEWRFRGLGERVSELKTHHERRLAELLDVVRRAPGSVPWDLAGQMTWSRPWDQYDGFMRVTAVAETTAHLVRLVRLGLVTETTEAVPRYRAVARTL